MLLKADPIKNAIDSIKKIVDSALCKAVENGSLKQYDIFAYNIETPADAAKGEFSTNAALVSAKVFCLSPKQIAEKIVQNISLENTEFSRVEVAGAGFINFYAKGVYFENIVKAAFDAKNLYGQTNYGEGIKVNVEFVSANPTGAMHLGNARGGALGDSLAALLQYAGYEVTREFLVNDSGNQIDKFGASIASRYRSHFIGETEVFPENGYLGEDIKELALQYIGEYGDSLMSLDHAGQQKILADYGMPKNLNAMKKHLKSYRIEYDRWFLESELHQSGLVTDIIKKLTDKGYTFTQEGALFYAATRQGAEKDAVLVRANGIPTYFAADIAYHYNKLAVRNFDIAIDVWGADHHGHIARLQGALEALGIEGKRLEVVLMQLVNLVQDGVNVRMSKRTGKAITLTDLLEEVPTDAARFFFNLREPTTHLDFDLDLAVKQNSENPVYYVQYAHARICRILESAKDLLPGCIDDVSLHLLSQPSELALIRYIAALPTMISTAAKERNPSNITRYLIELATHYHKFYNDCRVLSEQKELSIARLALSVATKNIIANLLALLKVDAPIQM